MLKYIAMLVTFLLVNGNVTAQEPELLFRLHGSNTVGAALAPELIKSWLASQGYHDIHMRQTATEEHEISATARNGHRYKIDIHAHGSSTAFADFASGHTDLGMASRRIKSEEVTQLANLGQLDDPHHEFVVGLDGIAVVVNKDNPIKTLDVVTLRQIFSGQLHNWREVGGRPGPIHVYARDHNSGTFDTFKHLVLDKQHPLTAQAKRYESNAKLSDDVSQDPLGIGFVGLPYIRHSKSLSVIDGGDPIQPTEFSVATEDYALARRLYIYVPTHVPEAARQFANYAVSEAGQHVVSQVGFISQNLMEVKYALPSHVPQEYRHLVSGAKRLSVNFRFVAGSITLDSKAMRDVQRLAIYLKRDKNRKRHLMLFGFSDSHESLPMYSLVLSMDRADSVADALVKFKIGVTRSRGYGSDLPVASNDTQTGRFKNRRVEVWLE